MQDDSDHQAIKELLEQSQIMIAVSIGVLLLMNVPTGSGGSIGFLGAAIGAGAGALAGALIGAAVAEDQAKYYHAPPGGYPYAERTETPGYVYSPYGNHNVIDVRGVPEGALVRDPSTGGIFRKP